MGLVAIVVTRDIPRKHARIGRMDIPGYQRDPDPGYRIHAEALQDRDMTVAASHEHEILHDGGFAVHSHGVSSGGRGVYSLIKAAGSAEGFGTHRQSCNGE